MLCRNNCEEALVNAPQLATYNTQRSTRTEAYLRRTLRAIYRRATACNMQHTAHWNMQRLGYDVPPTPRGMPPVAARSIERSNAV
jgi:hypothetical protein